VGELPGRWGVAVKKLDTGEYAEFNGDKQHVSASLYKLWVLSELYHQVAQGKMDLDDSVAIDKADAWYDDSIGIQHLPVGASMTVLQAASGMITKSSNTTAALLVRLLKPSNINNFMKQNGLDRSLLDWSGEGDNLTTPRDVLKLLEQIARGTMISADASKQMRNILLDQEINNVMSPGLPATVPFAHKHGMLNGLLHDAGIVYAPSGTFILVAMSSELPNDDFRVANEPMKKLASTIFDYFATK
jgi:beta-lactamase class A